MEVKDKKVNLPLVVDQLKSAWVKNINNTYREVIFADTNVPSPKVVNDDGLSTLTLYDVDMSQLDAFESANLLYFYGYAFEDGGERAQAIVNILKKVTPKVLLKIYVSDHATKLYAESEKNRKIQYRKYPVMFIEINRNSDNDFISNQYFKLLAPNSPSSKFEISKFIETITPLKHKIRSYYNFEYSLEELVEDNLESGKQQRNRKIKDEEEQLIKSKLKELVTIIPDISKGIEQTFRVEEDFWKHPQNLQYRHAMYKEALGSLINAFIFPDVSLPIKILTELRGLIPDINGMFGFKFKVDDYVRDMITTIIEVIEFCENVFNQIKTNLNSLLTDLSDSLDVLLAYACGVWNGIVDAVVGILDSIELVIIIVIELVFLPDILQISREILDELWQIDFKSGFKEMTMALAKFIQDNREKIIEKIDTMEHKAGNPRIFAYNFGYIVYAIVEMFLPPLKITRILSSSGKVFKPILNVLN